MEDGLGNKPAYKTFDSCILSVYISGFWGRHQTPTGSPPLTPAGGLLSFQTSVPTLTSEPGYTTDSELFPVVSMRKGWYRAVCKNVVQLVPCCVWFVMNGGD